MHSNKPNNARGRTWDEDGERKNVRQRRWEEERETRTTRGRTPEEERETKTVRRTREEECTVRNTRGKIRRKGRRRGSGIIVQGEGAGAGTGARVVLCVYAFFQKRGKKKMCLTDIFYFDFFLTHYKATCRKSLLKVSTILYPWFFIIFKPHF